MSENHMSSLSTADIDPYIEFLHKALDEVATVLIQNFPTIKSTTLEALETVFATKALARQLALAIALETGVVSFLRVNVTMKHEL